MRVQLNIEPLLDKEIYSWVIDRFPLISDTNNPVIFKFTNLPSSQKIKPLEYYQIYSITTQNYICMQMYLTPSLTEGNKHRISKQKKVTK